MEDKRNQGDELLNTGSNAYHTGKSGLDAYRTAKQGAKQGAEAALSSGAKSAGKTAVKAGASQTGASATTAASAGGPAGVAIAVISLAKNNKVIRYILIAALFFPFLVIAACWTLPSASWNEFTHSDAKLAITGEEMLSNLGSMEDYPDKEALQEGTEEHKEVISKITETTQEDMISYEKKWADIITGELENGLNQVQDKVKEELKNNPDIDYERSVANIIIANAGLNLTEGRGAELENEGRNKIKEFIEGIEEIKYKEKGVELSSGVDNVGLITSIYKAFESEMTATNIEDLKKELEEDRITISKDLGKEVSEKVLKTIGVGDVIIFGEESPTLAAMYMGDNSIIYMDDKGFHKETLLDGIVKETKQEEVKEENIQVNQSSENDKIEEENEQIEEIEEVAEPEEEVPEELKKVSKDRSIMGIYSPLTDDELVNIAVYSDIASSESGVVTTSSEKALEGIDALNEYEPYVYAFFREHGYSHAAACGFLGNFFAESHVDPTSIEADYVGSFTEATRQAAMRDMNDYCKNFLFPIYARDGTSINKDGYLFDGKYYCGCGLAQWTGKRTYSLFQFAEENGKGWYDFDAQLQFIEQELANGYSGVTSDEFKSIADVNEAAYKVASIYEGNSHSMDRRLNGAKSAYERYDGVDIDALGTWKAKGKPKITITSRTIAEIIAALSVKEDQYLGEYKPQTIEVETPKTVADVVNQITALLNSMFHTPERTLKNAVKNHPELLFDVEYGDLIEKEIKDNDGTRVVTYYSSIKITPIVSGDKAAALFDLDPEAEYRTQGEDGKLLGVTGMKVRDAVDTLTDTHMEFLYGNHDIGAGAVYGISGVFGNLGEGSLGNPLGTGSFDIGVVTSFVGLRNLGGQASKDHGGIDIGIPEGTPVYAAKAGTISYIDGSHPPTWNTFYTLASYGNWVQIDHDDGTRTIYAHLSYTAPGLKTGDRVGAGEQIGQSGNTGTSNGPHLHFEYHIDGEIVDPLLYLLTGDALVKYAGN